MVKTYYFINPYTDFGFKKIFGEEINKDILIDFLNTLLDLKDEKCIKNIQYLKNEHLGKYETDRKAIVDIYCETENNEKFIVEMQKARQQFFKDRTLFYASFLIQQQAKKDNKKKKFVWDYELKGVYSVALMDFSFGNSDKIQHDIMLKDVNDNSIFYEKLRFIYVEMPNFNKKIEELENHYEKWLYLLKNLSNLAEIPQSFKEEIFMKVFDTANEAKLTSQDRLAYQKSLQDYRDLHNSLKTSFQDGKIEEKKQVTINAIKEGCTNEFISKITSLTIKQIEQIRKEI
ncbi:MAG: Rpn family recombination-promoting nuclease/putative transposase [Cytophagia bacterium]|nr:MAG: Rpn family recombination-promoting nuclease/putative transposase [Cytophagia bacterium]TAG46467.1 MAG: Rpn family recombination-promoting nuclease/putative transposase [Cytophagia bacterium]TAH28482.1 MAG: Rpn family recombination-promoting nuclease/putative transposase [Cytophagales bacterium]